METTASDWKNYQVEYYNLDAIISVWYCVNSKQATEFRKWATSVLKNYLLNGFAVNKNHLQKNECKLQIFRKTLKNSFAKSIFFI